MADEKEKKNPKPDFNAFGFLLAGALGFGMGYVFFSKRSLRGGFAERHSIGYDDIRPRLLEQGARHEMEHTGSREVARQIALDHLAKDPDYYKRLSQFDID